MNQAQIFSLLNSLVNNQNKQYQSENVNLNLLANSCKKVAEGLNEIADFLNSLHVPLYVNASNLNYASAVKQNNADFNNKTNSAFNSKKDKPLTNTSEQNVNKSDEFMQTLVKLKNVRNDSFYKMKRNELLITMMKNNISSNPVRVPKNLAPKIGRNDTAELVNHKINVALQSAENEIQKLNLHFNIHKQKIEKLDEEIKKHIDSEPNELKRDRYLSNCQKIITDSSSRTVQKLNKKQSFFNSNLFMVNLNYKSANFSKKSVNESSMSEEQNEPIVPYTQSTHVNNNNNNDILSDSFVNEVLNDPFEASQHNLLKRKASDCSLHSSKSAEIVKKKQEACFTSTQLSQPTFMAPTISSMSKNDKASAASVKMKPFTQG